jgi:hypothetical protein
MASVIWYVGKKVSEGHTMSISHTEDGRSMFPRNVGIHIPVDRDMDLHLQKNFQWFSSYYQETEILI